MIQNATKLLVKKKDLTQDQTAKVMKEIMEGAASSAQIAGFIIALRMKGETVDEIFACADVMREKAAKITVPEDSIDTCGTGGDDLGTFNISTTAAFVAAGCKIPVAKHGNKSVSSNSGSADLLEALGVNIDLSPKQVETCVFEIGLGFLFAPTFHSAMKYAIGPRKELGVRTVFNILGPLTNPAGVNRQVLGVYDPKLTGTLANVLKKFKLKHALVVNGEGMDEISTVGPTSVSELKDDIIRNYVITPEMYHLKRVSFEDLKGGSPEDNARITLSVLNGEKSAYSDIVKLNAAAAIYVSGKCENISQGLELAENSIESGSALFVMENLVKRSNEFAGVEGRP
jgi:anthranilate phosphoribosyltransferase